ncbi:4-hydroxy-3-methylbut-2-enyl diphosphate reductase [Candidatus Schneideria nysicola]|uniref:4-hydroxy-3-methylbut-2-enyl diphosphate reductase n=1 Tax=Candidatus Schneideria nysicola TaxID=1081631 RepID=UPI001CAA4ACD|nr:4-hydroxy-3-methylbut-2-enyl diphosphate reductase [Candidatus Schneideria nysicola]UAJ65540.1 4-hydroxy-3-methylbut-2-enyl diphosphate reductase [Candidatus Schneideria nysicola]
MQIFLANPRGFCAGVKRAIKIVEELLVLYTSPIYVYHEIIHNKYIIDLFIKKGVIFVNDICKVPIGSVLVFSAHGVSNKVEEEAKLRQLRIFDATCPLVKKVHKKVYYASLKDKELILIGYKGHPEVEGTIGRYNPQSSGKMHVIISSKEIDKLKINNTKNLNFITQTTLSVDDTVHIVNKLRSRFPLIAGPKKNDICYATFNRQKAIKNLSDYVELILIVGSKNSSNSNRLKEIVQLIGKSVYLIDSVKEIKKNWLRGINNIGIISSASAPEILVKEIVDYLKYLGANKIRELIGEKEEITFKIPKLL